MRRYVAKTYSRASPRDTSSSKVFDEVIGRDARPVATQATATVSKWGKATFTSRRGNTSAEPETSKRMKLDIDDDIDDPFSFDSEEDSSPKKAPRPARNSPIYDVFKYSKPTKANSDALFDQAVNKVTEQPTVGSNTSRAPVKSCVRTFQTLASSSPGLSNQGDKLKQLPLDVYTKKQDLRDSHTSTTSSSSFSALSNFSANKQPARLTVKKFFTSSYHSAASAQKDHNYSQDLTSQKEETGSQGSDLSSNGKIHHLDSDEDDKNSFEFDSDMEVDSGDPEIIFNSPKKKKELLERKLKKLASDNTGRDSPASVVSVSSNADTVGQGSDSDDILITGSNSQLSTDDEEMTRITKTYSRERRQELEYGKKKLLTSSLDKDNKSKKKKVPTATLR